MRKTIFILLGILILAGIAAGSYWFLSVQNQKDTIPESGIFVMEDSEPCKLYI